MPGAARQRSARAALAALVALLLLVVPATAHADVGVSFLKGEQPTIVQRPGSTVQDAMTALLAGPTPEEHAQGVRTYIPRGTTLGSVGVSGTTATVDLGLAFVGGEDPDSLRARLTQVVKTLDGVQGTVGVRVLVAGGTPLGVFPGIDTSTVLTLDYLETPDVRVPRTPTTSVPSTPATTAPTGGGAVQRAQQRLVDLGYLLPGEADGKAGPATQAAVIAFQKWEGLSRDGVLGPATLARLRTATRPTPTTSGGPGKRVEVLLGKQLALTILDNQVVRALHVSTGAPATPTPAGTFRIQAKIPRWWSVPFREWLLWAAPFNGGIAFHQLADVPTVAASHGCVRLTAAQARWMFDWLAVGTPVAVLAPS